MKRRIIAEIICFCSIVGVLDTIVLAGDWPQILGPLRNGVAQNETISERLNADKHGIQWTYDLGQGFSGPAIKNGKVIVTHRLDNKLKVEALHQKTGRLIWSQDFDAIYRGGVNSDTGPRCVPVLHANQVIVFSAAGVVYALELDSGKKQWTRDLYGDYQGREGYFGAGSTPLVVDDLVLFNVGGKSAGFVALNRRTGKTIWAATDEGASYSSPTIFPEDNRKFVACVTRLNAVIMNPVNGNLLSSIPFGKRGPTVNAATPIAVEGHLFLTSSYGVGALMLNVKNAKLERIWGDDQTMSSQYNTPVVFESHIFGIHGREDIGVAELRCVDAKSGKVDWRQPDFGVAHFVLVGNKILAVTIDGNVVMFEANGSAFRQLGKLAITNDETRALPAMSQGRLYFRDTKKLYSLKVAD